MRKLRIFLFLVGVHLLVLGPLGDRLFSGVLKTLVLTACDVGFVIAYLFLFFGHLGKIFVAKDTSTKKSLATKPFILRFAAFLIRVYNACRSFRLEVASSLKDLVNRENQDGPKD